MAPPPAGDPFVYRPGHDASLIARAIAGEGQALFTASPGGAVATAARVARLRPLINAAVAGSGIDPDLLEGLVFVESAGRSGRRGRRRPGCGGWADPDPSCDRRARCSVCTSTSPRAAR